VAWWACVAREDCLGRKPTSGGLIGDVRLTNDRELMGEHVNSRACNLVAWATVAVMIVLTIALLLMQR
jgi:hypothetical protein